MPDAEEDDDEQDQMTSDKPPIEFEDYVVIYEDEQEDYLNEVIEADLKQQLK